MALGVDEASEAYQRAMRNIAPAGPGICRVWWAFIDSDYDTCFKCGHQPDVLDVVVPITYSEHLGQMHLALRNYKDGNSESGAAMRRSATREAPAVGTADGGGGVRLRSPNPVADGAL